MAALFSILGCGGIGDKHFCHLCTCHKDDRNIIFEMLRVCCCTRPGEDHLKGCPAGVHTALQGSSSSGPVFFRNVRDLAASAGMHVEDLIMINAPEDLSALPRLQKQTRPLTTPPNDATTAPDCSKPPAKRKTAASKRPSQKFVASESDQSSTPLPTVPQCFVQVQAGCLPDADRMPSALSITCSTCCACDCSVRPAQGCPHDDECVCDCDGFMPCATSDQDISETPCKGPLSVDCLCRRHAVASDVLFRSVLQSRPMDRPRSDRSLFRTLPLSRFVLCALHALMRITEMLFTALQLIAIECGDVQKVNEILDLHKCAYKIKQVNTGDMMRVGAKRKATPMGAVWYPVSLNGSSARALIIAAPSVIDHLFSRERAHALARDDPQLLTDQARQVHILRTLQSGMAQRAAWHRWAEAAYTMVKLVPSTEEVAGYGAAVRSFVLHWSNVVGDGDLTKFYLHMLLAHSISFMDEYRSLGMFMNEGVEHRHLTGRDLWLKGTRQGGGWGGHLTKSAAILKRELEQAGHDFGQTEEGRRYAEAVEGQKGEVNAVRTCFQELLLVNYYYNFPYCSSCDSFSCYGTDSQEGSGVPSSPVCWLRHGMFSPRKFRQVGEEHASEAFSDARSLAEVEQFGKVHCRLDLPPDLPESPQQVTEMFGPDHAECYKQVCSDSSEDDLGADQEEEGEGGRSAVVAKLSEQFSPSRHRRDEDV